MASTNNRGLFFFFPFFFFSVGGGDEKSLTVATLPEAEMAPTARVDCLRALRNMSVRCEEKREGRKKGKREAIQLLSAAIEKASRAQRER